MLLSVSGAVEAFAWHRNEVAKRTRRASDRVKAGGRDLLEGGITAV